MSYRAKKVVVASKEKAKKPSPPTEQHFNQVKSSEYTKDLTNPSK